MSPQASEDLRRRVGHYTEVDSITICEDLLRTNGFIVTRGIILAPHNHNWLSTEHDAVSYLENEWDYTFNGERP